MQRECEYGQKPRHEGRRSKQRVTPKRKQRATVTNKLVGRKSAGELGLEVPRSTMTKHKTPPVDATLCQDTIEERLHWNLLAAATNIGSVQKQVAAMTKFGSLPPIKCLCGAKSIFHPCIATPNELFIYWNKNGLDMIAKCDCNLHVLVSNDMPMHPTPEQLAKYSGGKVKSNTQIALDSVAPIVLQNRSTKALVDRTKIPPLMSLKTRPPPCRAIEKIAKVETVSTKPVGKQTPFAMELKTLDQAIEGKLAEIKQLESITEEPTEELITHIYHQVAGEEKINPPRLRQEPPTIIVRPPEQAIEIPHDAELTRRATPWNRTVWAKQPSRFTFNTIIGNHHIGRLAARKDQKCKVTVPDTYYDERLANYLLREKFASYKDRKETLDHMTKLARKYLQEQKVDFISYTPLQVIIHNATIQKIVDEETTPFILAQETANKERSRVKLWWNKLCRSNQYASKN